MFIRQCWDWTEGALLQCLYGSAGIGLRLRCYSVCIRICVREEGVAEFVYDFEVDI